MFYSTLHSTEFGQFGSNHVGVDALKHDYNSSEVCAFVGHTVSIYFRLNPLQNEWDVYLNTSLMQSPFVAREGGGKKALTAQTLAVN